MNYDILFDKKERFNQIKNTISPAVLESFEKSFDIEYAHNSTAIEGNTLTLIQTKVILEEGIAVGGKSLREIYEVSNHAKAFLYLKKCVTEGRMLDEAVVKDIHALLMENIFTGGIYRNMEVRISDKTDLNPMELAAWTHAEFVKIHPFAEMIAALEEARLDEYLAIIQE